MSDGKDKKPLTIKQLTAAVARAKAKFDKASAAKTEAQNGLVTAKVALASAKEVAAAK